MPFGATFDSQENLLLLYKMLHTHIQVYVIYFKNKNEIVTFFELS